MQETLQGLFPSSSAPILSKLLVHSPAQQTKGKESALPAPSPCTVPSEMGLNTCIAATLTTLLQTALRALQKWEEHKIWLFPPLLIAS